MQLLSVKIAAEGVLGTGRMPSTCRWTTPTSGGQVAVAVLDADGEELDGDIELWGDLDNGADVSTLIGNLSDDRGDLGGAPDLRRQRGARQAFNPCLDLQEGGGDVRSHPI